MRVELAGKLQNQAARAAKDGPAPVPTGSDHETIALRRSILLLVRKGVFELTEDKASYRLREGVEVTPRLPLLERLREGPLASDDWPEVSVSRNALAAKVSQLRARGHNIEAIPNQRVNKANGVPCVTYVLHP